MENSMLKIIENRQKERRRLIRSITPDPTPEQMDMLVRDFVGLDPSRHEASTDCVTTMNFNWTFPKTWRQHLKDRRVFVSFLRMRGFELV